MITNLTPYREPGDIQEPTIKRYKKIPGSAGNYIYKIKEMKRGETLFISLNKIFRNRKGQLFIDPDDFPDKYGKVKIKRIGWRTLSAKIKGTMEEVATISSRNIGWWDTLFGDWYKISWFEIDPYTE